MGISVVVGNEGKCGSTVRGGGAGELLAGGHDLVDGSPALRGLPLQRRRRWESYRHSNLRAADRPER
ncbi:hypothetical protein TSA6c_11910 [Azospirillum sp. TSA6c]|nr:hypothetical protein TSA6c_11910 [Azospirillum sp. TSA6c]